MSALFFAYTSCAIAGTTWLIDEIQVDGKAYDYADVEIAPPDRDVFDTLSIKRGTQLRPGTTIRARTGMVIRLRSPNGEEIEARAAQLKLKEASPTSESYLVFAGRVIFNVVKRLDFFKVSSRSISAQTRGTKFSVSVDTQADTVRYSVESGKILILRTVTAVFASETSKDREQTMIASSTLSAGEPDKVFTLNVSDYLQRFASYDQAERYFRGRLADAERSGEHDLILSALIQLGDALRVLGKSQEAIDTYTRALSLAGSREDAYWGAVLNNRLGIAHYQLGNYSESIKFFQTGTQLHEQLVPGEGEYNVEMGDINVADAYLELGLYRCAIRIDEKALSSLKGRYHGTNHPYFAAIYSALGMAHYGRAEYRLAVDHLLSALEILNRLNSPNMRPDGLIHHEDNAAADNAVGLAYSGLRDFRRSEALHRTALRIAEALFPGSPHPLKAESHIGIGVAFAGRGQSKLAVEEYQAALRILGEGPQDETILPYAVTYASLGDTYLRSKQFGLAVESYERALTFWRKKFPDEVHPSVAEAYGELGAAYRQLGEGKKARDFIARSATLSAAVRAREAECLR